MERFFPACTLCLMFVKPPPEWLLMPQYHLADRRTQRKHRQWNGILGKKENHWNHCSVLLTDKMRRESWFWDNISVLSNRIIHILPQFSSLFIRHFIGISDSAGGWCVFEKGRMEEYDERHNICGTIKAGLALCELTKKGVLQLL